MLKFSGMKEWEKEMGNIFKIKYLMRIVSEVMMKGEGIEDIEGEVMEIIMLVFIFEGLEMLRLRRKMDWKEEEKKIGKMEENGGN